MEFDPVKVRNLYRTPLGKTSMRVSWICLYFVSRKDWMKFDHFDVAFPREM